MYKIVIVDDEPIQCKGLKNILNFISNLRLSA